MSVTRPHSKRKSRCPMRMPNSAPSPNRSPATTRRSRPSRARTRRSMSRSLRFARAGWSQPFSIATPAPRWAGSGASATCPRCRMPATFRSCSRSTSSKKRLKTTATCVFSQKISTTGATSSACSTTCWPHAARPSPSGCRKCEPAPARPASVRCGNNATRLPPRSAAARPMPTAAPSPMPNNSTCWPASIASMRWSPAPTPSWSPPGHGLAWRPAH